MELTHQIKAINLANVVRQFTGMELRRNGNKLIGLCPLHHEKTPSFTVFEDNHFKCFGCGEYGDPVDFIQCLHGIDFKSALNHLGISQRPVTGVDKKKIAEAIRKRERRQELREFFTAWERAAVYHFSVMVRATYKAMTELTPENFNQYADIMQPLSTWGYWLDILTFGDDPEKFALFQEHRANGIKLLQRNNLFRSDFDFQKWLKERMNG